MSQPERDWEAGFPSLDLVTTPETPYDPETIAEKALWPVVDERWGGNFRMESEPNMPGISISRAGLVENEWYEVVVEAEKECDEYMDEESDTLVKLTVSTVTVDIEQLMPAEIRNMIELALEEGSPPVEAYLEEDENNSPEYQLRAMSGTRYTIDSDGDYIVMPYLILRAGDRSVLWSKGLFDGEVEEDEDRTDSEGQVIFAEPQFSDDDVKKLLIAATIFKAPQHAIDYLKKIIIYPEYQ